MLLATSVTISLFAFLSISDALILSTIPLLPPPDHFEEWYSDSLYIRSLAFAKAQIDGIFLLVLSTSYTLARFREKQKEHVLPDHLITGHREELSESESTE